MRRSRFAPQGRERDPLSNPFIRYCQSGNIRPSQDRLESSIRQLSRSAERSADPGVILTIADMCLDLAMADSNHAPKHLDAATNALDEAIGQIKYLGKEGYGADGSTYYTTMARLRLSEIPNWTRAATGQPLHNSYEMLLQTAIDADPSTWKGSSRSKMVEFMPVLLGSRALRMSMADGWFGRLGLAREEQRKILPANSNPNWDTGLLAHPTPAEFVAPSIRLQIKPKGRRATAYKRAGVIPLHSRSSGFNNPAQIIYSCLHEEGELPATIEVPFDLLAPEELNNITKKIYDKTHPSESIQRDNFAVGCLGNHV